MSSEQQREINGNKYYSQFDGPYIDEAVEIAHHLKSSIDSFIIDSSPNYIYDLNELIKRRDGNYRIFYYRNSANDLSPVQPIDVRVRHVNSMTIEQRYEELPGVIYYRTYDIPTKSYTEWTRSDSIRGIQNGSVIGVREKTLVFREVGDDEVKACRIYDGAQTVKVSTVPT